MDQLFYYSKSADKPAGKGTNEKAVDYNIYNELNKIKLTQKDTFNKSLEDYIKEYSNDIFGPIILNYKRYCIYISIKKLKYYILFYKLL